MRAKSQHMLDVEFLLERPSFNTPLIYLYRSGVLRAPMRKCLEEIGSALGRELFSCEPEELFSVLAGASLLSGFNICDWSRETRALPNWTVERTLELLASPDCGDCALFLRANSPLTTHPNWPRVEAASLVLEEPLLTPDTLPAVLRYLEATTDLADDPNFLAQPGFVESFDDLLEDGKAGLCDAMREFDSLVLTQTDPKTNEFYVSRHGIDQRIGSGGPSLLRQLRELVERSHHSDLVQFIVSLEERYRSAPTAAALIADMYRMTESLLRTPDKAARQRPHETIMSGGVARGDADMNAPLWAALVLAWEDQLIESSRVQDFRRRRGPDMTTVRWQQMGRDFLARAERECDEDPLAGLWAALRRALTKRKAEGPHRLAVNRAKMTRSLAHYLGVAPERGKIAWLEKLHSCVTASIRDLAAWGDDLIDPSSLHEFAKPTPREMAPRRFEEVLGQARAVGGLSKRVRSGDQSGGVILYGPAGVGKRTLARLFAKAVLCEGPLPSGSPCNRCPACRAFDEERGMGYTEFDARDGQPREIARGLVAEAGYVSFADRTVIVIRNADLYEPEDVDVFLKTLEEPPTLTTFVLLASDLKRMRVAVQSRCDHYRLRPLLPDQTKQLGKALSEAHGMRLDELVLDLLAVASQGLPGQLRQLIAQLAGDDEITLAAARQKFGFDWADPMIAYWNAILVEGEPPDEHGNLITGADPDELMRRLRVFLHNFHAHELCRPPVEALTDPALMHIEESAWKELVARFNERASANKVTPQELWSALALSVLSGDHFETASALIAGLGEPHKDI